MKDIRPRVIKQKEINGYLVGFVAGIPVLAIFWVLTTAAWLAFGN